MKRLIVMGGASQKQIQEIFLSPLTLNSNLMDILRSHGIPVASSCGGDGICQKCVVIAHGEKILSCMSSPQEVLKNEDSVTITLSYL